VRVQPRWRARRPATSARLGQRRALLTFPLLLAQMSQPGPSTFPGKQTGHRIEWGS
jgi:hypothetical protein